MGVKNRVVNPKKHKTLSYSVPNWHRRYDTYTAVCIGGIPPEDYTCSSKCNTLTNGGDQICLKNICTNSSLQAYNEENIQTENQND